MLFSMLVVCADQLVFVPLALADIPCGTTISSPGTYLLEADKSCPAGWITIDSDDVEIDLQRYRVVYNRGGAETDLGVFINRASRVSIHDGMIIQGSTGSNAHPIRVLGASWASGVTLFNLQIETFGINVTGIQASGESYDFNEGSYEVGQSDIGSYTHSGNAVLVRAETTPSALAGLRLVRFIDDNDLLTWDASREADVFHYLVYKDGAPIAQLGARGVRFYVDQDLVGAHDYAVVAQNLAGMTSPLSAAISTADAEDGWWGGQVAPPVDGGVADAGAADSTVDAGTTPPVDGSPSTADQGSTLADGPQQDGFPSQNTLDGGGCGCRTGGGAANSIWLLLGALFVLLWRRRRLSSARRIARRSPRRDIASP